MTPPTTKQMKLGYKMLLDLESPEENAAFHSGTYDAVGMEKCLSYLEPESVVLDIGAHVGFYSCALGMKLKPNGRIYAFEPVPTNHARLLENIALNNLEEIVKTTSQALGREATFFRPIRERHVSQFHIAADVIEFHRVRRIRQLVRRV